LIVGGGDTSALFTLSALPRLLLTAVLAALSGLLTLLTGFGLPAAALLPALTSLLPALLARLLFIRIHNCSFEFPPLPTTNLPGSSSPAACRCTLIRAQKIRMRTQQRCR
jgi:hypothetical protein